MHEFVSDLMLNYTQNLQGMTAEQMAESYNRAYETLFTFCCCAGCVFFLLCVLFLITSIFKWR